MEHFYTYRTHGKIYETSIDGVIIPEGAHTSCQYCSSDAFRQRYKDMLDNHMPYYSYCDICLEYDGGCINYDNWIVNALCPNYKSQCPSMYVWGGLVYRTMRHGNNFIVTFPQDVQDHILRDLPMDERVNSIIVHNGHKRGITTFIVHCEVRDRTLRPGVLLYANNAVFQHGPVQHPRMHNDFSIYPFNL